MKRLRYGMLCCVLLVGSATNRVIASDEAKEIFEAALEASRSANFIAEFDYIPGTGNDIPGVNSQRKIIYYRYTDDGFVFRRLDISGTGIQYIENRQGKFGVSDVVGKKLRSIDCLGLPESTHAGLSELEMANAAFSLSSSKFYQKACWEVTVKIPSEPKLFQEISGLSDDLFRQYGKMMMKGWAVTRIIKFDKETLLIRSREHRNSSNKKIFSFEFTKLDTATPLSEKDFEVTGVSTADELNNPRDFISLVEKERLAMANRFSIKRWFSNLAHGIRINYVSPALAVLGIGLLLLAYRLRLRGKV
ncbi:hypothetical protein [Victivallis sp. Marseille-Q1083]|uniref:hypothetical protein n=1 Tax=Victivallis sp. Marseille-Q1083 TaxID=2717288 RepID=UPI00158F171B|nr:hypothetical protein [Victivallis sp. Marseille-Q1083]